MSATRAGGLKTAATIKAKYGKDFYKRIGTMGGNTPRQTPRGFALNRELASRVGKIGGKRSAYMRWGVHV